ncbi:MAG: recombinase family protein [Oscillospiraceae bacterium]|jgi:DNA invertase Pin-like site-specific DNA recombinase|nr:recombinase family protein [Oscillospiraceae bacterium]
MQIFGYIRVSTTEQRDDRQRAALEPFGIPPRNLYTDHWSGKDFDRPAYKRLIKRLCPNDLLIVKSVDRLGRSYADVIEQWRHITKTLEADIKVLDMPLLDTTFGKDLLGTFIADLVLQILSFASQLERDELLRRQAEGITAAKSRGVTFGPDPMPLPEDFPTLFALWTSGEITAEGLAERCGFSRTTLFKRLREQKTLQMYLDRPPSRGCL